MTANARYSDPFTSADKEVAAPEGAEFVVVRAARPRWMARL